ncbi:MAG: lactate utilization protein [Humidesulfovibrio sp.]|uniref:lactate utilization protein n=1 Tax=Humidesulfovibrio sp. TaxID=2910988 RepID=UPI0027E94BDC|nr:lactate utilization protein [Humidesulfovibrio sp.]MDQ7835076.1 lactate utilization protein [Humidesulfovibrio sp.]
MSDKARLADLLTEKAGLVSAIVSRVKTMEEAYAYTLDVCDKKEACQLLPSGCESDLSSDAGALCDAKLGKIIAAPGLPAESAKALGDACAAKGVTFITSGMRKHLAGVDIGFTMAQAAIAETGTCVIDSRSEELRLATMICEVHVCVVPLSVIRETSFEVEGLLRELCKDAPGYVAFVTGASRTADIERVLAIGVHGPLELHILLLED